MSADSLALWVHQGQWSDLKSLQTGRVRFTQKHFLFIETCTMAEAFALRVNYAT